MSKIMFYTIYFFTVNRKNGILVPAMKGITTPTSQAH